VYKPEIYKHARKKKGTPFLQSSKSNAEKTIIIILLAFGSIFFPFFEQETSY
jgi:hypothetical protein